MRFPKEFWVWLIETQLEEIKEHKEIEKLENEFADIIGIAVQAIQELSNEDFDINGKDTEVKCIVHRRIKRNIDRIPEITYKYRNKWIEYEQKTKEYNEAIDHETDGQ